MEVLLLLNGSKKLTQTAAEAVDLIHAQFGASCTSISTKKGKDAIRLARENANNYKVIIAVGGDGTSHEVLNGIVQAGIPNVRFGIIPNGTGNDFMKMVSEFNPQAFLDSILNEKFNSIDIGILRTKGATVSFLNIADIGLGGKVVEIMNRQRKLKIGGKFSYASAILRGFLSYKKPVLRIEGDEFVYEGKVLMLAACNGSTFGHGLVVGPEANVMDGIINITLLGKVTVSDYLKNLKKIKNGVKINHPEVEYYATKRLKVTVLSGNFYAEADGELVEDEVQYIELNPRKLKLINELKVN